MSNNTQITAPQSLVSTVLIIGCRYKPTTKIDMLKLMRLVYFTVSVKIILSPIHSRHDETDETHEGFNCIGSKLESNLKLRSGK